MNPRAAGAPRWWSCRRLTAPERETRPKRRRVRPPGPKGTRLRLQSRLKPAGIEGRKSGDHAVVQEPALLLLPETLAPSGFLGGVRREALFRVAGVAGVLGFGGGLSCDLPTRCRATPLAALLAAVPATRLTAAVLEEPAALLPCAFPERQGVNATVSSASHPRASGRETRRRSRQEPPLARDKAMPLAGRSGCIRVVRLVRSPNSIPLTRTIHALSCCGARCRACGRRARSFAPATCHPCASARSSCTRLPHRHRVPRDGDRTNNPGKASAPQLLGLPRSASPAC
jgi:hypothetical protein